jgi:hypothetical protein
MKNLPKNSKISLFKKTWVSAQQDAKSANKKALEAGKILSELKEENKGSWTKFVEVELDGFIGIRQADKLIKCYENKLLISLVSNNEPLTINAMIKIIAEADQEQLAQVEQLKKEEELAELAKLAVVELPKAKKDDVIDGVFVEVKKPEPVIVERPVEDPLDILQETIDMLEADNAILQTEMASIVKVLDANDQLTAALAEVKKFQELARVLKESLNGSMNSENAAKRQAKMWKAKYEKLAKEVGRE